MRWLLPMLLASGCAAPLAVHRQDLVLGQVADHYRAFYPAAGDPDPAHDEGLLRPRFGLPAIAQTGGSFPIELLEHGESAEPRAALLALGVDDEAAERCLAGEPIVGCYP